ncbi:Gram-negative porin [Vibrio sp. B1REV9]|uniref:porin n=1 Tax=Vibrio sp. B1REV9 TaxID=2751179 RepID=UPI001AF62A84|nr:porin [Vibrio sp. B1REV9]CAE6900013.1 Gram-negative porin [Vibrio sp. B1REV9]
MKKTLLALAVAGISTSALAAGNIYDNGESSFNISGEIDTYLSTSEKKTNGVSTNKKDADIDLWAKIQIDAQHKLNQDVTLFGSFEIENGEGFAGDADNKSVSTDDLYFGAYIGQNWGVAVGEIGDFGDTLDAITLDITNEGYDRADDFVNGLESGGHAAAVKGSFEKLTVIADVYLDQAENNDVAYGFSAEYALNDMFTVGAMYQDQGTRFYKEEGKVEKLEYSITGASARFNMNNFEAAVAYIVEDINNEELDTIAAAAAYQINDARLYTTFGFSDGEKDVEGHYYTLGTDYKLSANLKTFIEYSVVETEDRLEKVEGDLVVAGAYYTF